MWLVKMDPICALDVWVGSNLQSFSGLWRGSSSVASMVDCGVQLVGCLGGLDAFMVSIDFFFFFFLKLVSIDLVGLFSFGYIKVNDCTLFGCISVFVFIYIFLPLKK